MKLFNTMTRTKEEVVPVNSGKIGIYTCGPTVYNKIHIGNFKTFLFEDILVRYLRYKGYDVTQVMNITDIDDKTIRASREKKIPLSEVTEPFIGMFHTDRKALHITDANFYPRATYYIPQMVDLVKKLLDKGVAYKASDDCIYYSIAKFPDYGKLAHLDTSSLMSGASGRNASDEC